MPQLGADEQGLIDFCKSNVIAPSHTGLHGMNGNEYPTLKGGASLRCAYGAGAGRLQMQSVPHLEQAVTQPSIGAEIILFRPLTRAEGDSLPCAPRLAEQFLDSFCMAALHECEAALGACAECPTVEHGGLADRGFS